MLKRWVDGHIGGALTFPVFSSTFFKSIEKLGWWAYWRRLDIFSILKYIFKSIEKLVGILEAP